MSISPVLTADGLYSLVPAEAVPTPGSGYAEPAWTSFRNS